MLYAVHRSRGQQTKLRLPTTGAHVARPVCMAGSKLGWLGVATGASQGGQQYLTATEQELHVQPAGA